MYVEVKKKSGGKYEVTPDVTPTAEQSLTQLTVEGCMGSYGPTMFLDANFVPVHIDNVKTKSNWNDVQYAIYYQEYADVFYARVDAPIPEGFTNVTRFDTIEWDDGDNRLTFSGPQMTDGWYFDEYTSHPIPLLNAMLGRYYG